MTAEEKDAIRMAHCIARVICNGLGVQRPESMPTDADIDEHHAYCYRRWEELMAMDQDDPEVMAERKAMSAARPTPVALARLREFRAESDAFTYDAVRAWWERKRTSEALQEQLRTRVGQP